MQRLTLWLWVALAGAVLQFVALGSNFYIVGGEVRDAWFGIPHASDLIVLSALVTVGALSLTALGRNPLKGRNMGLAVGIVGLLATLQLGYRMIIPPFGCLVYSCSPSDAAAVTLLPGIWIGLVGCIAVALGGFVHAFSGTATDTPAVSWATQSQGAMTPWLGLAALGAVAQFVFGYTFFSFYTVRGFVGNEGAQSWGGWLATPHTSSLILLISVIVVGLVVAASRARSPLAPAALGGVIAVLGFAAASRIFYRMIQSPFSTAGGSDTAVGSVALNPAAYLSLIGAILVVVAGIVQAVVNRQAREAPASGRAS